MSHEKKFSTFLKGKILEHNTLDRLLSMKSRQTLEFFVEKMTEDAWKDFAQSVANNSNYYTTPRKPISFYKVIKKVTAALESVIERVYRNRFRKWAAQEILNENTEEEILSIINDGSFIEIISIQSMWLVFMKRSIDFYPERTSTSKGIISIIENKLQI